MHTDTYHTHTSKGVPPSTNSDLGAPRKFDQSHKTSTEALFSNSTNQIASIEALLATSTNQIASIEALLARQNQNHTLS